MKSRTSFFDKTVFKKDLTRFAPSWAFYTICLFMGMTLLRQGGSAFSFHRSLDELPQVMAVINFVYAFLNVQLLWGDLYNSRLCNALHALPLRRENWFITHTASGLCYSLIPTLLVIPYTLLLGIGSNVEQGWHLAFWWALSANLQYLFFFGLGTLCIFCVGNRFAHAVIYAITNFASILAFWLVDTLYTPLLFGLHTPEDPFMIASPCVQMSQLNYLSVERLYDYDLEKTIRAWYELGEGWGYLVICAAIGVALLAVSCLLYRKRKLECAGDFMAIKGLEPVFLVVFPLVSGALAHYFCDEMVSSGRASAIVFLFIGIFLGFFAAKMLLERNIRVFGKKAFLQLALLTVAFGATLLATSLDPLGLVTWIPEHSEITAVEIFANHYGYDGILMETPEEIEDALAVHQWAIDNQDYDYYGYEFRTVDEAYYSSTDDYADFVSATKEMEGAQMIRTHNPQQVALCYYLNDGSIRYRYYYVDLMKSPGEILIPYYSSMEKVFESFNCETTVEYLSQLFRLVRIDDTFLTDPADIRGLLEAIEADCISGNMAQRWNFRPDPDVGVSYHLNFASQSDDPDVFVGETISIYTDCDHTNKWLTDHGITSAVLEELVEKGTLHFAPG